MRESVRAHHVNIPPDNQLQKKQFQHSLDSLIIPGAAKQRSEGELVQGTLDMLILKTLAKGAMHGYGIAQSIQQISDEALRVEEGSLYPALHRLELDGMIDSEWGQSANNRRAKYYSLTARGRKQLQAETSNWLRLSGAIARVIEIA